MAKASEEAYNPSYIHPAKRSASPGEFVESVRCEWVRLAISGKVRGPFTERLAHHLV